MNRNWEFIDDSSFIDSTLRDTRVDPGGPWPNLAKDCNSRQQYYNCYLIHISEVLLCKSMTLLAKQLVPNRKWWVSCWNLREGFFRSFPAVFHHRPASNCFAIRGASDASQVGSCGDSLVARSLNKAALRLWDRGWLGWAARVVTLRRCISPFMSLR